jgi:predicted neutral ceramidase superfamily lipid hydrolase
MRRRSGGKLFVWLGIWSAIEGTEYLFGSLADLGLLPNWLLPSLPYVGTILSFSVVAIALLAFLDLSQGKLRLFLQGAIVVGLAIAVAGIALFLFTGSSFKVMPFNHLLAAISLTVLAIVVAVPKLSRRFLVLPNRTVLSIGILVFALEAVYGNLSLPLRLPSPPEILDPLGFAVLLFCFGFVAVRSLEMSSSPSAGF